MRFPEDLEGWPHAEHSRQLRVAPHLWHVQEMGDGPLILLLHGAGGATHSWRDLMPRLSERLRVIALDLPGHGFTRLGARNRSSLEAITNDLARLITGEGWRPVAIVGHSAGGAIALRVSQTLPKTPKIVAINTALQPFGGLAGIVFPAIAKTIAALPFATDIARQTLVAPDRAGRLLAGTGSNIDAEGVALYARLLKDRDHVEGALQMMAQWSLDGLLKALPTLQAETFFLLGANDKAVPPRIGEAAARRMRRATTFTLPDLGHLAHEEAPEKVAALIRQFVDA